MIVKNIKYKKIELKKMLVKNIKYKKIELY